MRALFWAEQLLWNLLSRSLHPFQGVLVRMRVCTRTMLLAGAVGAFQLPAAPLGVSSRARVSVSMGFGDMFKKAFSNNDYSMSPATYEQTNARALHILVADEAQANSIKGELEGGLDFMEAAIKCAQPRSATEPRVRPWHARPRCHCPPRSMPLPSQLDVAGSGRICSQGFPHPARLAAALRAWRRAKYLHRVAQVLDLRHGRARRRPRQVLPGTDGEGVRRRGLWSRGHRRDQPQERRGHLRA